MGDHVGLDRPILAHAQSCTEINVSVADYIAVLFKFLRRSVDGKKLSAFLVWTENIDAL